jgi:hypothetical protein
MATPQPSEDPQATALRAFFEATHGVRLESRGASWTPEEIQVVDKVLALLPEVFVSQNPNLRALVRESEYDGEYEHSPGFGMYQESAGPKAKKDYVVVYDKGLYSESGQLDPRLAANTLIHEISHSLDDEQPGPYQDWLELSGWFQTDGNWLPTRDLGFVNSYSRGHPKEDFAETFTLFVMDPDRLRVLSPEKHMFMERLFDQGRV